MLQRPDASELEAPYRPSLEQVPEGDVLEIMAREIEDTAALLASLAEETGDRRYAPGKWTVKEVVGHLVDTERIMTYRALCFARGETIDLPGYEQDDYVVTGRFGARTLESLSAEFRAVRAATIAFYRGLDDAMLVMRGRASGCSFSVRALAYSSCGHEIHHKRILRERYLR